MTTFGLADKAVAKSREREGSALSYLGVALAAKRIAFNLFPASIICGKLRIARTYLLKVSGPMLHRFDIKIDVIELLPFQLLLQLI